MERKILLVLVLSALLSFGFAARSEILFATTSKCFGMYSRSSIPGAKKDSTISLNFDGLRGDFSWIIFMEDDSHMVGYKNPTTGEVTYICTKQLFEEGNCYNSTVNQYIVDHSKQNISVIWSDSFLENAEPTPDPDFDQSYLVERKGLYCVMITNTSTIYSLNATLVLQNPYGDLPAEIYPYLPFYGFVGLSYLLLGLIWLILSACYWQEILQVQVYISGVILLCMIEMTFLYAYYADYNENGQSSQGLLSMAVILNSARNSVSFVCLLVVCMGYGLVKPTLGTTAKKVLGLGFVHFIFGTLFAASTMLQTAASQKVLALLFVFPLAITLTLFYSWTFSSLTITIRKLEIRRQTAKARVYKHLSRLLIFSIFVLFTFLVLTIIQRYDDNYQRKNWDSLWFTTDGWVHLLYFFVFTIIIFLWRPQKNNSRYQMQEIPQDDEDAMVSTGGAAEKIKLRNLKKGKENKSDDEEDALQWAEENLDDDPEPITLEEEAEEKIARREIQKKKKLGQNRKKKKMFCQ